MPVFRGKRVQLVEFARPLLEAGFGVVGQLGGGVVPSAVGCLKPLGLGVRAQAQFVRVCQLMGDSRGPVREVLATWSALSAHCAAKVRGALKWML